MALYRKYRPATFAEVVGQEHVTDPLSTALDTGRISHAYLFSGPRGCGKTSSARILARSLNCAQGPTSTPCGVCASCVALGPGGPGNLDVIELDAASHGGVDDTRELRDRAFYAPAESRYRVFIVDEAHMVTTAGFNALLKIVEEPPAHLIFIFATTEPDKVLPTIRSRTHHYPFRLLPPATMRGLLGRICEQESVPVEEAVYPLVIRAGGGSPRDSLSVLDQLLAGAGAEGVTYARAVSLLGVTDVALIDDAVGALADDDGAALFATVDRVMEAGHDPRRFAVDLLERFRDLILMRAVPDATERGLVAGPGDVLDRMRAQAERLGPATLTRYAELLHAGLGEMRGATAPRLLLEVVCARMLLPSVSDAESATLQRLERLERGVATGAIAAAPAGTTPGAVPAGSPSVGVPSGAAGAVGGSAASSGARPRRGAEMLAEAMRNRSGSEASPAAPERPTASAERPSASVERSSAVAAENSAGSAERPSPAVEAPAADQSAAPVDQSSGSVDRSFEQEDRSAGRAEQVSASADQSSAPDVTASVGPSTSTTPPPASATSTAADTATATPSPPAGAARSEAVAQGTPSVGAGSSAFEASSGSEVPAAPANEPAVDRSTEVGGPVADAVRHPVAPADGAATVDAARSGAPAERAGAGGSNVDQVNAGGSGVAGRAGVDVSGAPADRADAGHPGAAGRGGATGSGVAAGRGDAAESGLPVADAASAVESSAGGAETELSQAVEGAWAEIRAKVREHGAAVHALLSGASVARVEGGAIVFAHQHAPLAKRLSEPRNLDAVRSAVRAVLGRDLEVRWESGAAVRSAPAQPARSRGAASAPAKQQSETRGTESAPPRFSRPSQANRTAPQNGARRPADQPRPAGDDDIPPPDFPDLPDDPGPGDFAPPDPVADYDRPSQAVAGDPTPEEEREMLAEAARPVAPEDRRDPDEVALELLRTELGATRLDG